MTKLAHTTGLQLQKYLAFRKDPLAWLYETRRLGDIVAINPQAKAPSYVVHAPAAVKEILTVKDASFRKGSSAQTFAKALGDGVLTTEGEQHRRQRKMLQPAFHKKYISSYADTIATYACEMMEAWKEGDVRQTSQDMMDITLRVIVKTMFGADIDPKLRSVTEAVNDIIEKTASTLLSPFQLPDFLPTAQNKRYKQGIRTLDELAGELISFGKQHMTEENLLSLLLNTKYEDGSALSEKEIRDQVVTIVIGGHETTANLLTWIWYVLATHPEIEAKFHEELRTVLQGQVPTFSDLPRLTYTNQIIQEALRLYPPGWIVMREANEDVEITGHQFRKNSIFLVSPYVVHRNEALFEAPHKFRPERFTKDNQQKIANYSYFPFGAGSRGCMGTQFALMEAAMILATIGQCYRLELLQEGQEVQPEPLVSLRVRGGLSLRIQERKS